MTPPDSHDDPLSDLRRRWEAEPGSRLFLQLAEEYRRSERYEEALEVLRTGLKSHPGQVSGLVSLGRIHLALEAPGEAAEALEEAVDLDPTNPLALKLATEAHLQAGDRGMARQRLEMYKLVNSGDDEVEALEARVSGNDPTPETEGDPAEASAPPPEIPAGDAPGSTGGWSPTAAWPALPGSEASTTALSTESEARDSDGEDAEHSASEKHSATENQGRSEDPSGLSSVDQAEAADAVTGGYVSEFSEVTEVTKDLRPDPFGDLTRGDDERRYLVGLANEGIFPFEAPPEPTVEPTGESATEVPVAGKSRSEEEPASEVHAETTVRDEAVASPWAFTSREDLDQAPSLPELPPSALTATGIAADDAAQQPSDQLSPTVTLGQLYLDQGHHAEALAIFHAVLDRDPDNLRAQEGRRLALAAGRDESSEGSVETATNPPPSQSAPAYTLTAQELLRTADPDLPPRQGLLRAYLDRLRGRHAS